jgi:hypothetical protein
MQSLNASRQQLRRRGFEFSRHYRRIARMNRGAEQPFVQHAAGRQGERAGYQDAADIQADQVSAVRFDIASARRKVCSRDTVNR